MRFFSRPRTAHAPAGTTPVDYTYDVLPGGVLNVVDGDTIDMRVVDGWHGDPMLEGDVILRESGWFDMGFHVQLQSRLWQRQSAGGITFGQQVRGRYAHRFRVLGIDTPERGQTGFREATEFTRRWLTERSELSVLRARSAKADSFGRWLVDLVDTRTGETLTVALLGAGYARYTG